MATPLYNSSVFINCPFDDAFVPIRNAIVFANQIASGLTSVKARPSATLPCGDALHSLPGGKLFGISFPLGGACSEDLAAAAH